MKSFMIIFIAFCAAYVSGIRVPVWPERELIKTSTPYGNNKQLHFENHLKSISVSSAPTYSSSSPTIHLKRNVFNVNNNEGNVMMNIRHNNPERLSFTNSFLRPPPDATLIIHPVKTNKNYSKKIRQTEADTNISEHELPKEIPTRPIYPGEAKWAKKGIKHFPHKSNVKYQKLSENEPKPEGHEIFENNAHVFEKQQNEFARELSDLSQFSNPNNKEPFKIIHDKPPAVETETSSAEEKEEDSNEEIEDDSEEENPSDFVPIKTYSQVRRTEDESHLPRVIEEPRLREVIKDTKIITVYSEEGYEDSAYDHEGHEKKAENSEGYAEASGVKSKKPTKKFNNGRLEDYKKEIAKDAAIVVDKYFSDEAEKKHKQNADKSDDVNDDESGNENGDESGEDSSAGDSKVVVKKIMMTKTSKRQRRSKRYVNDFPKLTVDTDFVDEIRPKQPAKKVQEDNKYPYYNLNIYKNSPLKYAEDLNNIPKKIEGELSFYKQADKVQCQEVESDVNPIPEDRIRQAEKEETGENKSTPKTPRLGSLGDKIDCYKAKYFGEEPFDSPLFKEDVIEPPEPIFAEFQEVLSNFKSSRNKAPKTQPIKANPNPATAELKEIEVADSQKNYSTQPEHEDITFAASEESSAEIIQNEDANLEEKDDFYNESLDTYKTIDEDNLEEDEIPVISHQITPVNSSNNSEGNLVLDQLNITSDENRQPKSSESILQDVSSIESTSTPTSEEMLPEKLPYRMQKRRKRPYVKQPYPTLNIFDVSRYIPPVAAFPSTTTSKYKTLSEVYYKDEIKPDEQLNVFADVMNIIKNSSNPIAEEETEPVSIKLNTKKKEISTEYKPTRHKYKHFLPTTTQSYLAVSKNVLQDYYQTSTPYPTRMTATQEVYDEFLARLNRYHNKNDKDDDSLKTILQDKDQQKFSNNLVPVKVASDVVGLTPPIEESNQYLDQQADSNLNTYYFLGLRPPPKVRPISYIDYKPLRSNKIRRKAVYPTRRRYKTDSLGRYKREATNSRAYASISRGKEEESSEEDDYEPNRRRSFHYDVKTGKIIYDKKTEEPPIEYEEYEEEEEKEPDYGGLIPLKEPVPISKKQTTTEGPPGIDFSIDRRKDFNYVDFVDKLKADKTYVAYPDPTTTTTEKDATSATTTVPQKTTPPEFLSLLSKVRSDDSYKEIKDKDDKKRKTTTPAPEEDEEEENDEDLIGIQNSPGGGQNLHLPNLQIFDISEYLPQVKSYTPRTTIDTSKYKSIDRSHTRQQASEESKEVAEEVKNIADNKSNASVQQFSPPHTTTEPTTTTTKSLQITTRRRKVVRTRTRHTTVAPSTTEDVATQPPARHKKPSRTYPRRKHQRQRIHTTPSPEQEPSDESVNSSRERIQRRVYDGNESVKQQQIVPNNHKEVYTPIIVPEDAAELFDLNVETHLAMPRIITPEIVAANLTSNNKTKINPNESDVEVFSSYDATKRHGGNYKKEEELVSMTKMETTTKLMQLIDPLPLESLSFYTDSKLPVKINQLEVDTDETLINESKKRDNKQATGKNNDDYFYEDEVKIKFEHANELTTKKPLVIKDPNKRLYFYAPL